MNKEQHLATSLELPASLRDARRSEDVLDSTMMAIEAALARVRELTRTGGPDSARDLMAAWLYLGDVLSGAGYRDQGLEAFSEAARIARVLAQAVPAPGGREPAEPVEMPEPAEMTERARRLSSEVVQRLLELADGYLADGVHACAWDALEPAIALEMAVARHSEPQTSTSGTPWTARIDNQVTLLRRLFGALVAEGRPDQAAAVVSLARSLRQGQAELLDQDLLGAAMESLLREVRMLRGGLRDIEAWPLLQEAVAMRQGLQPPALDRLTMNLARQLIDAAVVFHCSNRNALAMEAAEIVGSFYSELVQRSSGYNASALRELFDDLPMPLRRVAEGGTCNLFMESAALEQSRRELSGEFRIDPPTPGARSPDPAGPSSPAPDGQAPSYEQVLLGCDPDTTGITPPDQRRALALGSDSNIDVDDDSASAREPRRASGEAASDRPGPRVLIVDDSALMLDMAKEALETAGYRVDIAQVLSQIADDEKLRTFDLILMDVMMPELQGDDVAVVLRDEIGGISAPIYLLSSLGEQELARRAAQAGIEGYISKRAGMDALVTQVRDILDVAPRPGA